MVSYEKFREVCKSVNGSIPNTDPYTCIVPLNARLIINGMVEFLPVAYLEYVNGVVLVRHVIFRVHNPMEVDIDIIKGIASAVATYLRDDKVELVDVKVAQMIVGSKVIENDMALDIEVRTLNRIRSDRTKIDSLVNTAYDTISDLLDLIS